ncbi:MAG: carbohydrate-binding domain-containing protein [Clostridia bacterium]|nr:carbohydrate-binding domain-containing protein [Clostridia bacterium]
MKQYRYFFSTLSLIFVICMTLCACATKTTTGGKQDPPTGDPSTGTEESVSLPATEAGSIVFDGGNVNVGNTGAQFANGILTISKAGSYELSGKSESCGIVVAVDKSEQVELILAGVELTNPVGPVIYCDSADKLFLTVKEGTTNALKDGVDYPASAATDGPNAAVYSDDDLTIRGTGTLRITALYNNGISSKNDIKIKEVTLTVDAYNTAIRGKESVTVGSGNLTIKAGNDGIKATEEVDTAKGFVTIEGGTLNITAGDDALQASLVLNVTGGKITAAANGKLTNAPTENVTDGIING